jgi:thiamine pyrophosphate-dependent acetolactate synthase large subunit-like protein
VNGNGSRRWGSDVLAEVLRDLDVEYVANVPGSSYRGLHDSIVNHLGNHRPELVLALHEEAAVAIAHGYAKVTGRMMAAAVHANIGLQRASMAIYNAWCDRAPVLVLGATGPWDAASRTRQTEWLHTSTDQGGLVRAFTKWDDQPGSAAAAEESLLRAAQLAQLAPCGPVYVNLDASLQEEELDPSYVRRDVRRVPLGAGSHPSPAAVADAVALLDGAARPVFLLGRTSRRTDDWDRRVALAERLGAPVLTDLRYAAAFPTDHALHLFPPLVRGVPEAARELLRSADVIVAFDWPDLAATLSRVFGTGPIPARVIEVSCDVHNHRGGSQDFHALPPRDLTLLCETDAGVSALLDALPARTAPGVPVVPAGAAWGPVPSTSGPGIPIVDVGRVLATALADTDVCFTRLPFAWDMSTVRFRHPLDHVGHDGGSGVGSGPGITVGAALALRGSGRLPVAVLGDGDFLMGNTALWTAAHMGLPCLFIVRNNRSFYTDERHQAHVALSRGRTVDADGIGARIETPAVDIVAMATALGAVGIGPVDDVAHLRDAIEAGVEVARAGRPCVVDVHVARADGAWPPVPTTTRNGRVSNRVRRYLRR